jgi:uncharacterized RDD family membrane protein YckC
MNKPDTLPDTLPTAPQIASLWRRLAAIAYDSFLVFAIWIVVGFGVMSIFGIDEAQTSNGVLVELSALHQYTLLGAMLLSAFLFFGFFWTHSGQTLGMQAWRVRVQNLDGTAISWRQALLRFCTAPFALLALGLGYLMMLADKQQRTLPDLVSGSQVLKVAR